MRDGMKYNLTFLMAVILATGCQSPSGSPETTRSNEPPRIEVPRFNSDSAYEFIRAQLAFGPRVPGTKAHEACAQFLASKLGQWSDHGMRKYFP